MYIGSISGSSAIENWLPDSPYRPNALARPLSPVCPSERECIVSVDQHEWFMLRDMLLRAAKPGDEAAVADVHVRSWQAAYRTLLPDEYLDQLRPEDRAKKYNFRTLDPLQPQTIVATEAEVIHGFATTAPARESETSGCGELCALYVDPDQWGRGIGRALVAAARSRLFDLGFRHAVLWVLVGNVRAERFYRMDLWAPDGRRRAESVWGVTVDEIRYRRTL